MKYVVFVLALAIEAWAWGDRLGWGHIRQAIQRPDRLYKDPTDYTKPLQIIQRPKTLYKALAVITKPHKGIRRQNILDKTPTTVEHIFKISDKD